MKKGLYIFNLAIILILAVNVSAGVYFSDVDTVYNLGDTINVQVNVNPVLSEYLLKVDLTCDDKTILPFNLMPNAEGKAEIIIPLNYNTIKEVSSNCYFSGDYGGEIIKSRKFEISKKLGIYLSVDSFFAKPGEKIEVAGNVRRQNGVGINGDVELSIPLLSLQDIPILNDANATGNESNIVQDSIPNVDNGIFYGKITDGQFLMNFDLLKDTPAGDYRIDILAYETSASGKKMSEGSTSATLQVFQILTSVDIALSSQNFNPGEEISFIPQLLDQSGVSINDDVSVYIKNKNGKDIFQEIVKSGESIKYKVPTNLTSGYYDLIASSGDFSSNKKFFINEKAIVFFELRNETLIVKNIGNIPYNKDVQVELNGKPFIKKVNLGLEETKEFRLTGTNENYDVKISDGESQMNQAGVMLTGNAVGVKENKGGFAPITNPIVWIFIIIVLGGTVFFFFRNSFRKKSFAYPFSKKKVLELKGKDAEKNKEILQKNENVKELLNLPRISSSSPSRAEQGLVSKGYRNTVSVMVLKIKNKLTESSKASVERAIEEVYSQKGAVYEQGDYVYAIFSPLVTKTFKNEISAIKSAQKILNELTEHNKKFADKIDFGIAVSSGEIINRVEDKKLKFTGLGSFIPGAKRIAESANKQAFLTREVYEKCGTEVKADRRKTDAGEFFELREIVDHEKSKKFISDFLRRQRD